MLPAVILLSSADSGFGDRIEFVDGRIVVGVIVTEDKDSVTVKIGDSQTRIFKTLIKRIVRGTDADHLLISADSAMRAGRVAEAIDLFEQAALQEVSPVSLAVAMQSSSKEITASAASLTEPQRRALTTAIDWAQDARLPDQGRFVMALLKWRIELGDHEEARRLMETARLDHPPAFKRDAADLAIRIERRIDDALAVGKFSDALEFLIQLRKIAPLRAGNKRGLLVLQWASDERDQGNHERALEIYSQQLRDDFPRVARDRILETLAAAEREARERGQLGKSIELYRIHGRPFYPEATTEPLAKLWRDLGWKFLGTGDVETARDSFWRSELLIPGSAVREFRHTEFRERRADLVSDDYLAHIQLGEWCLEAEMLDEAEDVFESAAAMFGDFELRSFALQKVRQVSDARVERELDALFDLYTEGQYAEVMRGLAEMRHRPIAQGFKEQVARLSELARERSRVSATERPLEAEVLWQQAERALFTGDVERGYSLLMTVIERYDGTPAAARAAQFYNEVKPRLDVARLERARVRYDPILKSSTGDEQSIDPAMADEIRRLRSAIAPDKKDR